VEVLKRIFISVFIVLGLALLGSSLHAGYYALASRAWPQAEGVVLESAIAGSSRSGRTHVAEVRYRYWVSGRPYEADRLYFAGVRLASDLEGTRRMLAGLAPGRKVAVSYDPARPERAVLRPGLGPPLRFGLFAGAEFIGFGLLCFHLERRAGCKRLQDASV